MLLRDAQLARMNSEMMGDNSQEVAKEFSSDLETALIAVEELDDISFDKGILHSTLAQTYDRCIFLIFINTYCFFDCYS